MQLLAPSTQHADNDCRLSHHDSASCYAWCICSALFSAGEGLYPLAALPTCC